MIPVFRGKQTYGIEYVKGELVTYGVEKRIRKSDGIEVLINGTTLAIHFPDMLDSEKKPIFAALNESGLGGDIVVHKSFIQQFAIIMQKGTYNFLDGVHMYKALHGELLTECKVIEIYEGD